MCDTEFPALWLSARQIMYFEWGEVINRMRRKSATEFVTSDEMTLREFFGAILLFRNEYQYCFVFLIKIILKKVYEYMINRL